MKTAIVTFDNFTDVDLWLMWDILNRVRVKGWSVQIVGSAESHISVSGIPVATQGTIADANNADAVLFVSGPGTRERIVDEAWLSQFKLNPEKQLIGSICSG